jgi:hypothetical protein
MRLRRGPTLIDAFIRCLNIACGLTADGYPYGYFQVRPEIYRRDAGQCQLCGKKGKACHHIDYDRLNNDPMNLVILCSKCHVQTNYRRPYWQDRLSHIMLALHGEPRSFEWNSEQIVIN